MTSKEYRVFINTHNAGETMEVKVITTENGDFRAYLIDTQMGFVYREHTDNLFSMGWDSVRRFIRERCRCCQEVDYEAQMAKEKELQLQWGAWVLQRYNAATDPDYKTARKKQLELLYAGMVRYGIDADTAEAQIRQYHLAGRYPATPDMYKKTIQRLETPTVSV